MPKEKLIVAFKISPNTMAKMSKGEYISMEVLHRIREYFEVPVEDVMIYMLENKHKLKFKNPLSTIHIVCINDPNYYFIFCCFSN